MIQWQLVWNRFHGNSISTSKQPLFRLGAKVYLATYFKIFKYLRELYDIQN